MIRTFNRALPVQCGAATFLAVLATSFSGSAAEATIAPAGTEPAISQAIAQIGDLHRKGAISADDGERALSYYLDLSASHARIIAAIPPDQLIPSTGRSFPKDGMRATRFYQIAGNLGNPDALLKLGELYLNGDLISADPEKAFDYFQKAAALGSETASVNIGMMMINGNGTAHDVSGGMSRLFEAAENGNGQALMALGNIFRTGEAEGIQPDPGRSFAYFERAAAEGNTAAALIVARMMIDGEGVSADPEEGYGIVRSLHQAGDPGARLLMGDLLLKGIPEVLSADAEKAYEVYGLAARDGSTTARVQVALMQIHGQGVAQDVTSGLRVLQEMAGNGDAPAAFKLGQLYEHGQIGAVAADPAKAFGFYKSASAGGEAGARIRMAKLMIEGNGTDRDAAAGVKLLEELAENRHLSDAYLMLGEYYSGAIGDGSAKDLARAFDYYRKAANANSMTGRVQTALMLLRGEGTQMDRAAGLDLLKGAGASGDPEALIALGNVHLSGEAGAVDAEAAIAAFEAAAEQGVSRANILLGDLFSNGKAVPPDGELAIFYYKKAAGLEPEKRPGQAMDAGRQ